MKLSLDKSADATAIQSVSAAPQDGVKASGSGVVPLLEGTLVTRDLKRILAQTWTGGRAECEHERARERACLDCGAVHLPVVSFHALRHLCASLLLAAGVPIRDVSELLGHSDVRLTLTNYAHVLDENRAKVAGTIDRVFDSQSDSLTVGRGQK